MIWAQVDGGVNSDDILALRLVRNSTAIGVATGAGSRLAVSAGGYWMTTIQQSATTHWTTPMQFLDSPATTSAITYKVQGTCNGSGRTIYVNRSATNGDNINSYVAVSTITVMEVPA
jgi:hypothetical protein